MLRVSLAIIFISVLIGCSNQGAEQIATETSMEKGSSALADSNPGNIKAVCGVLFRVKEFDVWSTEYNKKAEGTIVMLRMVDDPSFVIVFEGTNSVIEAEARASTLIDDEFLTSSKVIEDPIVSYFDVRYMRPPEKDYKHYLAIMFKTEDLDQLFASFNSEFNNYEDYGLTPVGVGTNPENEQEVYMLLTLEDFVSFRKRTNSPGEMRRFISSLKLPKDASILNWARADI